MAAGLPANPYGTAPWWTDSWAGTRAASTSFGTSIFVSTGSPSSNIAGFYPDDFAEDLSAAAKRAAHLLQLSIEAIARACRRLRLSRSRAPVLRLVDAAPTRACSLSGSWRAQGPP